MNRAPLQTRIFGIALLVWPAVASAQLPSLDVRPWHGHFIGLETRHYHFGLTTKGKGAIAPLGRSDKPVARTIHPSLSFLIEESFPDGRVVARQIQPESLETEDGAATEFEALSFRGRTTGDASFIVHIENLRNEVSVGGRITDPGTLTRNPIRFVIRITLPSAYRNVSVAEREEKAFLRRVKDDRLVLRWTDGQRVKQAVADPVSASAEELNGPGIAEAKLEVDAFQGKSFLFTATGGSAMTLSNRTEQPLHEGFTIDWRAPIEAPQSAAEAEAVVEPRLVFEVK